MDIQTFYDKLVKKQDNTQRWNSTIEDIIIQYNHHFPESEQIFTRDELWDYMFTIRTNHLEFHTKIWGCFKNSKYNSFFKLVYTAMDDPDSIWWTSQYKVKLE